MLGAIALAVGDCDDLIQPLLVIPYSIFALSMTILMIVPLLNFMLIHASRLCPILNFIIVNIFRMIPCTLP
jgi:hypothetical protein